MSWHISIITPPAIEPVTLDEALEQCHANTGIEDEWFYRTISAARQEAETFQRRAYIEQTIQLTYDNWPKLPIMLPRAPVIELVSFKLYDVLDVETDIPISNLSIDYDSAPARITTKYNYTLPSVSLRELSPIKIQYKAGYGALTSDVPERVRQAILFYVAYMYTNRAAEVPIVPDQFYHMLAPQRMHL